METQPVKQAVRDNAAVIAALLVFVGTLIVVIGVPQPDAKLTIRPFTVGNRPFPETLYSGRGFGAEDLLFTVLPLGIAVLCAILGLALARRWLTGLAILPGLMVLAMAVTYAVDYDDLGGTIVHRSLAIGTIMLLIGSALVVAGGAIALAPLAKRSGA